MPPRVLTFPGSRIQLISPPPASDDESVRELYSSKESTRHLGIPWRQHSLAEVKTRREQRATNARNIDFAIHLLHTSPQDSDTASSSTIFVGLCNLNVEGLNMTANAGIVLSPAYIRSGYATEALYIVLDFGFSSLMEMRRITFETSEKNAGMRGWCRGVLGVDVEYRQQAIFKDNENEGCDGAGHWCDLVAYTVFREEWLEGKKSAIEKKIKARAS